MAATLFARIASAAVNYKSKAVAVAGLLLSPNGSARGDVTTFASITSGTGAPTEAAPNGSVYMRTDGTDADDSLYMRVAGAWLPVHGQTA